jgi:hypothetical protein
VSCSLFSFVGSSAHADQFSFWRRCSAARFGSSRPLAALVSAPIFSCIRSSPGLRHSFPIRVWLPMALSSLLFSLGLGSFSARFGPELRKRYSFRFCCRSLFPALISRRRRWVITLLIAGGFSRSSVLVVGLSSRWFRSRGGSG